MTGQSAGASHDGDRIPRTANPPVKDLSVTTTPEWTPTLVFRAWWPKKNRTVN